MSLQTDVLLGVLHPQILHLPDDVHSHDEATGAIEWADAYGMDLDEAQQITLHAWMGTRRDGTWAASQAGHAVSRQNGKGDELQACEGYGITVLGEPIIHTAHEVPTAVQAFLRMVALFEAFDDLRRLVRRVRYANGEQGIELLSGAGIFYKARTGSGARGFDDIGKLVYDEAQHCRPEHLAASSPTMAVHPNPQALFTGSAGLDFSDVWWGIRKRGIVGHQRRLAGLPNEDKRLSFVEHTAERVSIDDDGAVRSVKPDASDRRTWAAGNPTYNVRIPDDFLASQLRLLGPELFLREHGGVWDSLPGDDGHVLVIPKDVWAAACDPLDRRVSEAQRVVAWDVSPDRTRASIGFVALRADGRWHQEVVAQFAGTEGVAGRVASYVSGAGATVLGVVVVKGSPAYALLEDVQVELKALGVALEVTVLSSQDYAAGCGSWFDKVTAGTLRRCLSEPLDSAVSAAVWRDVGDVRVWDRRNAAGDITALCAVTAALRGIETLPPKKPWSGAA